MTSKQLSVGAIVAAIVLSHVTADSAWAGRRRGCCDVTPAGTGSSRPLASPAQPTAPPKSQPPAAAARPKPRLAEPFQLDPLQQLNVDQVLAAWEKQSSQAKAWGASFTRWDYTQGDNEAALEWDGTLACGDLNQWSLKTTQLRRWNKARGIYEVDADEPPIWYMRNGNTLTEFDTKSRRIIDWTAPADRNIALPLLGMLLFQDPLPWDLIHHVQAQTVLLRYYVRVITPQDFTDKEVWIDAFPRDRRAEAGGFRRAILRLKKDTFELFAMRMYYHDSVYRTYQFGDWKINTPYAMLREDFIPKQLCTWRKIVETIPAANDVAEAKHSLTDAPSQRVASDDLRSTSRRYFRRARFR